MTKHPPYALNVYSPDWQDHDRKNREWIAAATPLVAKHEAVLKPALTRAFDTPWEKHPIRVEMIYVTNASAYTAIFPTLITVSSSSPRTAGPAMVEVLFHESSHALIVKARDELSKEARNRKTELPYPDLWHALLFYTNSEIVRKQLPELEPYANKLLAISALSVSHAAREDWIHVACKNSRARACRDLRINSRPIP